MSIYKPSLLDKFKDFVNGLKANWDDYEQHKADYETHKADYETHKAEYEAHVADFEAHLADTVTDNVHGLQDRFKDAQIIKVGSSPGVVIDMDLENGFYLLLISRDNAVYYIGVWYNMGAISEIIPMPTGNFEISITGKRLLVDFKTRSRGYVLLKIS